MSAWVLRRSGGNGSGRAGRAAAKPRDAGTGAPAERRVVLDVSDLSQDLESGLKKRHGARLYHKIPIACRSASEPSEGSEPPAMRPPKAGVAGWAVRAEIPGGDGLRRGPASAPRDLR